MKEVNYKFIEHERVGDAPFIGALISAVDCNINCEGCFNQWIKDEKTISNSAKDLISLVLENPFNNGIILAGLEWSMQLDECIELCIVARESGLKTMIYTGHSIEWCRENTPEYFDVADYVKFGEYNKTLDNKVDNGILLATNNQEIWESDRHHGRNNED